MSSQTSYTSPTSIFRVDQFTVPAPAVTAFMARIRRIQQLLATQPGCRQNHVLTATEATGQSRVLTLVEWESSGAMVNAQTAVKRIYAEEGFEPAAFMRELQVRADMGEFRAV